MLAGVAAGRPWLRRFSTQVFIFYLFYSLQVSIQKVLGRMQLSSFLAFKNYRYIFIKILDVEYLTLFIYLLESNDILKRVPLIMFYNIFNINCYSNINTIFLKRTTIRDREIQLGDQ